MAISNLNAVATATHTVAESSKIKATISGHLADVYVVNSKGDAVDFDNGTNVKVGAFTGNGLQERTATFAGVKDKINFVCSAPIVKDATTPAGEQPVYFYHVAGQLGRTYEIQGDAMDGDIFAVSSDAITPVSDTALAVGQYIVVNGAGKWQALAAKPTMTSYGFVGQIHSIVAGMNCTMVRIYALQNVDNN